MRPPSLSRCLAPSLAFTAVSALLCIAPLVPAQAATTIGSIERLDPALDALIPKDAKIEMLAEGFTWTEGPVWKDGALIFSDVPANIAYRWAPGDHEARPFVQPSGGSSEREGFAEPGSNGLTLDPEGRLVLCQDATRRVARMEGAGADARFTTLADRFEGKRFNSPNDIVFARNGDFYFTDPPYGLKDLNDSPLKELNFNGVFRVTPQGKVTAVIKDLTFPNGIAFSPDQKLLYIGVTDPVFPRIIAYDVQADGELTGARLLFDARPLAAKGEIGSCDGMKVDVKGNIFSSGPGGMLIISPEGRHLGTIHSGNLIANCAWGGDDSSVLYMTSTHQILRLQTTTTGRARKILISH